MGTFRPLGHFLSSSWIKSSLYLKSTMTHPVTLILRDYDEAGIHLPRFDEVVKQENRVEDKANFVVDVLGMNRKMRTRINFESLVTRFNRDRQEWVTCANSNCLVYGCRSSGGKI